MILFKVTDVPATHEGLVDAGYDVTYGRRLYMEHGETVVTSDPSEVVDRDYYTLAYAEKRGLDDEPATATFAETAGEDTERARGEPDSTGDDRPESRDGESSADPAEAGPSAAERTERAVAESCGDDPVEGSVE